jgi:hypothetical protein
MARRGQRHPSYTQRLGDRIRIYKRWAKRHVARSRGGSGTVQGWFCSVQGIDVFQCFSMFFDVSFDVFRCFSMFFDVSGAGLGPIPHPSSERFGHSKSNPARHLLVAI